MSKATKIFTVILTMVLVFLLMPILPVLASAAPEKTQAETPDSLLGQDSTTPNLAITILPTNQDNLIMDARVNQIK
jgi:hypothetical protein